jgi:hypothetical protein
VRRRTRTEGIRRRRTLAYYEQNGKCYYCGCQMTLESVTLDHRYPVGNVLRTANPADMKRNVASCRLCNQWLGVAWAKIKQLWGNARVQETAN